jgi:glycine dehydrogenase
MNEVNEIKEGKAGREDNVLRNAPHTVKVLTADKWDHQYDRQKAAFPLKWVIENKFWPSVGRVDDGYGDRNLVTTCDSIDEEREKTFE